MFYIIDCFSGVNIGSFIVRVAYNRGSFIVRVAYGCSLGIGI